MKKNLICLFLVCLSPVFGSDTLVSFQFGGKWSSIVYDEEELRLMLAVPKSDYSGIDLHYLTQSVLESIIFSTSDYDKSQVRQVLDSRDTDMDGVSDYVELRAGLKYWDAESNFANMTNDFTDVCNLLSDVRFLLCLLIGFCLWECWDISARRKNFY